MLTIQGQYNQAIIYTDHVDQVTYGQILAMCNLHSLKESQIRIMPDTHAGVGAVVGTALSIKETVIPALVGVDIGCGLHVIKFKKGKMKLNFDKLQRTIEESVPTNSKVHEYAISQFPDLAQVNAPIDVSWALRSLGTLGGGNHFIELNEGKDAYYLVIHSGSRSLGKEIAEFYQQVAFHGLSNERAELKILATSLRKKGNTTEAEKIERERTQLKIPREVSHLKGNDVNNYLNDMKIAQEYAAKNRELMAQRIIRRMKWQKQVSDSFDCPHNYIDLETNILRKGATSAKLGEQLIIPLNMRDGSILATGKGNKAWNESAPHGAGRVLSRTQAKQSIRLESFKKTMKNVWSASVSKSTLDEAPAAYKNSKLIIEGISETVSIDEIIKPLFNFKP